MFKVIGIDEAGKGPVIGSMFIGFSIINLENGLDDLDSYQEHLKSLGVRDSKLILPKKRKQIYEKLKSKMDIKYVQLTPKIIDDNFFGGGKLNELEINSIVKILEDEKPDLVLIDALTALPEKFGLTILNRLSFDLKIISENKADLKYEIVGAASIIAKELREEELRQIRENINLDCGSGYPADPKTQDFLKKNWNNSEFDFIFRKSWQTYRKLSKKSDDKSLLDF